MLFFPFINLLDKKNRQSSLAVFPYVFQKSFGLCKYHSVPLGSGACCQMIVITPTANTEEARDEAFETKRQVERLMGKDPEQRFKFIIERAKFAEDLDI